MIFFAYFTTKKYDVRTHTIFSQLKSNDIFLIYLRKKNAVGIY